MTNHAPRAAIQIRMSADERALAIELARLRSIEASDGLGWQVQITASELIRKLIVEEAGRRSVRLPGSVRVPEVFARPVPTPPPAEPPTPAADPEPEATAERVGPFEHAQFHRWARQLLTVFALARGRLVSSEIASQLGGERPSWLLPALRELRSKGLIEGGKSKGYALTERGRGAWGSAAASSEAGQ